MPTLDGAQLRDLQARPIVVCSICDRSLRPNYCRQHDVFFDSGHMSSECTGEELHDAHRTY